MNLDAEQVAEALLWEALADFSGREADDGITLFKGAGIATATENPCAAILALENGGAT